MELESRIHLEQIRLSYAQGLTLVLGAASVAVLITLYLWLSQGQTDSFAWLAAVCAIASVRVFFIRRFKKSTEEQKHWRHWGTLFWLGTLASGLVWGLWWPIHYESYDTDTLFLITAIFAAMCAVSSASGGTYPVTYFSFAIPLMLPLLIAHVTSDVDILQMTGVLMMIYIVVCSFLTLRSNRQYRELISARYQNTDLMQRLEKEKQTAENAVVEKSRFLAAASHDLRQPLHAMGLFLAALRQRLTSDDQIDIINNMSRSTEALNGLFNSLLDVSRLDAGMVIYEPTNLNCDKLFADLMAQYQYQAEAKNLTLTLDCGGQVLFTDSLLFERVLRNLLSNSVQYTVKGEITLRVHSLNNTHVLVELTDTGIGIPEREIDSIFNEYYQLNNPERDRTKGLGLGLAIVKRLCKLMDMQISVESGINTGTKFQIKVPRGNIARIQSDVSINALQLLPNDTHVLIVDDEEQVLSGMQYMLEAWGCSVISADSARGAIKQLALTPLEPDIILCDYRLRENKTGLDAVAVINEFLENALPAIIITGDTSAEIQSKVVEQQLHVMHKPVSEQQLLQAMSALLAHKQPTIIAN